jgi:Ni/Fe-hydrogenase subunit HybB-like protein
MNRVHNTKIVLWLITGFAAAIALNRFVFGLGATTNLNDEVPWGFWIGFKLSWVALSAGGFVIGAIFYMMRLDKFHSLVRIAILTAFLGYSSFIVSLIFDLGLPWNIWHMIIYWNPHSPLFEVGWCVMLYTTVLILEFLPVPLESTSRYAVVRRFLMKFRFPIVLLGIMLSTLHQSSLGTLFLIMPRRLFPLFYSHIIPIEFFISAIAGGLMMLAFETLGLHWLYRRKLETDLVRVLCSISAWVLGLYFIVKIGDVAAEGKLGLLLDGSWVSYLYIGELLLSTVIPFVMFVVPKWCANRKVQWVGTSIGILGVVLNRIDIGGFAMRNATLWYTPLWTEVMLSFGILSTAALVFLFLIEKFNVWDVRPEDPESLPHTPPVFDRPSGAWLGSPNVASATRHTLAFALSFAVSMALISSKRLHAEGIESVTVRPATGIDTLCINGNRDDQYVEFPHQAHILWMRTHKISFSAVDSIHGMLGTGLDSCNVCHHLNLPGEKLSNCWECHTSMYANVDFFRHDWHASASGANLKCDDCHKPRVTRTAETAKKCTACHPTYKFTNDNGNPVNEYFLPSYVDAMHKLCVSCHTIEAKEIKDKPNLALCSTCHKMGVPPALTTGMKWNVTLPRFDNVILPDVESSNK